MNKIEKKQIHSLIIASSVSSMETDLKDGNLKGTLKDKLNVENFCYNFQKYKTYKSIQFSEESANFVRKAEEPRLEAKRKSCDKKTKELKAVNFVAYNRLGDKKKVSKSHELNADHVPDVRRSHDKGIVPQDSLTGGNQSSPSGQIQKSVPLESPTLKSVSDNLLQFTSNDSKPKDDPVSPAVQMLQCLNTTEAKTRKNQSKIYKDVFKDENYWYLNAETESSTIKKYFEKKVQKRLYDFFNECKSGEHCILFLTGHGDRAGINLILNQKVGANLSFYQIVELWQNRKAVKNREAKQAKGESERQTESHLLIIVDACYLGRWAYLMETDKEFENVTDISVQASSTKDQTSQDSGGDSGAYFLNNFLYINGMKDLVYISDYKKVDRVTQKKVDSQTPTFFSRSVDLQEQFNLKVGFNNWEEMEWRVSFNFKGSYVGQEGEIIRGEFKSLQLNGLGGRRFENGRIDKGFFKNDKLHGFGSVEWNGFRCQGIFEKGILKSNINAQLSNGVEINDFNVKKRKVGKFTVFVDDLVVEEIREFRLRKTEVYFQLIKTRFKSNMVMEGQCRQKKREGINFVYDNDLLKFVGMYENGRKVEWVEFTNTNKTVKHVRVFLDKIDFKGKETHSAGQLGLGQLKPVVGNRFHNAGEDSKKNIGLLAEINDELFWHQWNQIEGSEVYEKGKFRFYGLIENGQPVKEGKLEFNKDHFYEGSWRNKKPNGKGTFQNLTKGLRYVGEWKDGWRHGSGKMLFPTGESFKGAWLNDNAAGKGELHMKDGFIFEGLMMVEGGVVSAEGLGASVLSQTIGFGEWKSSQNPNKSEVKLQKHLIPRKFKGGILRGRMHGLCSWEDEEGSKLESEFFEGLVCVEKQKVVGADETYEGDVLVEMDLRNLKSETGISDQSNWVSWKKHGKGRLRVQRKGFVEIFEGVFRCDVIDGYGKQTIIMKDSGTCSLKRGVVGEDKMEGYFYKDKVYTEVSTAFVDGSRYNGYCVLEQVKSSFVNFSQKFCHMWSEIKKHGFGTETLASGESYKGMFINNKKEGFGCLTKDNEKYTGEFLNGMRHGRGELVVGFEDETYLGDWQFDKKNGKGVWVKSGEFEYNGDFKDDKMNGTGELKKNKSRVINGTMARVGSVNYYFGRVDIEGQGEFVVVFDQTDNSFFKADLRRKVSVAKSREDLDICPLGEEVPLALEFFKGNEMVKVSGALLKDSFRFGTCESRGVPRSVSRDISQGQNGTLVLIEDGEDGLIEFRVVFRDHFCATFEVSQMTFETYVYKTVQRNLSKVTFPFTRSGQQSYSIQFSLNDTVTREFVLTSLELDIYSGEFQNNFMSGHGRMEEANGSVYEGSYRNNQWNGKGTLILPDGSRYIGEFANNKYHGEGELRGRNGDLYKGSFDNGLKSGFGQLVLSNGDSFGGQFRKDMKNGFGRLLLKNGESYEGYFQDDLKEGEGTLVLFNGQKYKGVFLRGFLRSETKKAFYVDGSYYVGECLVDVVVSSSEQPRKESDGAIFDHLFDMRKQSEMLEVFGNSSVEVCLPPPMLADPNFVFQSAFGKGKFVLQSGKVFTGIFDRHLMQERFHGRFDDKSSYNGMAFFTRTSNSEQKDQSILNFWKFFCKHGKGKSIDTKGNRFRGTFHYDVMEGDFVINYANEEKYTGQMSDNMRNGKGVMEFKNFDVYEGEFHNDRMHGKGKLTTNSGTVSEGQFWEDAIQGPFKVTYINGDVYEGEFFNSQRDGKGKFVSTEGETYVGEYHLDKKQGVGTLVMKGQYEYQGNFQNDLKHGEGSLQWTNGERYQGNFFMDSMEGNGVLKTNNFMYEGNFKDNRFDKFGKLVSLDQSYLGEFKDNQKSGSGIMSFISGDVYSGQFSKNRPNGMGEMIIKDKSFKGFFVDGYLQVDKTSIKFDNGTLFEGQCLATPRKPFEKPEKWDFDENWVFYAMQGKGKLKFPSGYEFEGEFIEDFAFLKNRSIKIDDFMYNGGALYKVKESQVGSQGSTFEDHFEFQHRHDFGKLTYVGSPVMNGRQRTFEQIMEKECLVLVSPLIKTSDQILDSANDPTSLTLENQDDVNKKAFDEKWTFECISSLEGNFDFDKLNGHGKAVYKNNDIYEGDFVDNLKHGQGKLQTSNGLTYEGSFEKDKKVGKGVLKVQGSFEYEGEFSADVMWGKGEWVDCSMNRYKGSFREGLKSGFGVLRYSNGDVYEGQFLHGLKNGTGKLKLANGEVYEGLFLNDKKHGKGIYSYSKDFSTKMDFYADYLMMSVKKMNVGKGFVYEGECLGVRTTKPFQKNLSHEELWTFHKKHGQGLIFLSDKTRISGDFQEDMRHGKVVTVYSNKNQLELTYQDDQPVEVGIYKTSKGQYFEFKFEEGMVKMAVKNKTLSKGETYTGEVLMRLKDKLNLDDVNDIKDLLEFDCLNGKGVINSSNGTVFQGFFNKNNRVGTGVTVFPNGDMMVGKYHNNLLKGPAELKYKNGNIYEGILTIGSEPTFKKEKGIEISGEREKEITKTRNGEAKFTLTDGYSLVGRFKNNNRHGIFTMTENTTDEKTKFKTKTQKKKQTQKQDSRKLKLKKNVGFKYFRDELI